MRLLFGQLKIICHFLVKKSLREANYIDQNVKIRPVSLSEKRATLLAARLTIFSVKRVGILYLSFWHSLLPFVYYRHLYSLTFERVHFIC